MDGHRKRQAPQGRLDLHPKIVAAGLSIPVSTVLLWALRMGGLEPPPDVAAAITALIVGLAGWLAPERPDEAPVQTSMNGKLLHTPAQVGAS